MAQIPYITSWTKVLVVYFLFVGTYLCLQIFGVLLGQLDPHLVPSERGECEGRVETPELVRVQRLLLVEFFKAIRLQLRYELLCFPPRVVKRTSNDIMIKNTMTSSIDVRSTR